jgi:hypothetical protein
MDQKYGGMDKSFIEALKDGTAEISPAIVKSLEGLSGGFIDNGDGVFSRADFMEGTNGTHNYNTMVNEILYGKDNYELRRNLFADDVDARGFKPAIEQKVQEGKFNTLESFLGHKKNIPSIYGTYHPPVTYHGAAKNIQKRLDGGAIGEYFTSTLDPNHRFKLNPDGQWYMQSVDDSKNGWSKKQKVSLGDVKDYLSLTDYDSILFPGSKQKTEQGKTPSIDPEVRKQINFNKGKSAVPNITNVIPKKGAEPSVDKSDPSTVVTKDMDNYTGQGTYTWETSGNIYVGEWKDGDMHGQGTKTWADGSKYVGEFKDGERTGQGTLTDADGDTYVGEFKNDRKDGQGTFTYYDGDTYVGEFKNDKMHGQGTFIYDDGSKYIGEFKDGAWHGKGVWTLNGEESEKWYWDGEGLDGGEKEFLEKQRKSKFDASKDPLKKEMLKNKKKGTPMQKDGEIPDIAEAFPKQPEEKEEGAKPGDLLLKPESSAIKGPISQEVFLKQGGVETKVNEVATKHGFSMENLLNLINKESNFDTTAVNKDSKATGLIQFMPKTAIGLGTTTEKISKMSILEQLDLIDKYFTQNHKKGEHPYITIAYPKAHNMGMDEIIATPSDSIAKQNPPWRNKDGNVTKRSIIAYADKV